METTKLTVRVPRELLLRAKEHARAHQTSVSRLISEYLRRLPLEDDPLADAPIVRRLSGMLSPEASVESYRQYLEQKYGGPPPGAD